jgi:hypothetical protein
VARCLAATFCVTDCHAGDAFGTIELGTAFGYSPQPLGNVLDELWF